VGRDGKEKGRRNWLKQGTGSGDRGTGGGSGNMVWGGTGLDGEVEVEG
jgi:hypothetical protein